MAIPRSNTNKRGCSAPRPAKWGSSSSGPTTRVGQAGDSESAAWQELRGSWQGRRSPTLPSPAVPAMHQTRPETRGFGAALGWQRRHSPAAHQARGDKNPRGVVRRQDLCVKGSPHARKGTGHTSGDRGLPWILNGRQTLFLIPQLLSS